jgi:hypothetical protein
MAQSHRDRRGHRNRSVDVALARSFGHDRRLVLVFSTRYGLPLDPRTSTTGSRCKQRRRVCRAVGALGKTNVRLVAAEPDVSTTIDIHPQVVAASTREALGQRRTAQQSGAAGQLLQFAAAGV